MWNTDQDIRPLLDYGDLVVDMSGILCYLFFVLIDMEVVAVV